MELELQSGVELFGRAGHIVIDPLGPGIEAAEADFGPAQGAAVEPDAALGQPGEEGAVVTDDDERALEPVEPVLEPLDRAQIEMVGRFVEQQDVGVLGQRPGDRRAPPLAAARGRGRAIKVDAQLVGDCGCVMFGRSIGTVEHPLAQGRMAGHHRILFEQHDMASRNQSPFALVGVDQAGEAFEQGRLARAVAADQRQPVARADVEVEAAEQPALALDQPQVFIGKDRRGHGGPLKAGFDRAGGPSAGFLSRISRH